MVFLHLSGYIKYNRIDAKIPLLRASISDFLEGVKKSTRTIAFHSLILICCPQLRCKQSAILGYDNEVNMKLL